MESSQSELHVCASNNNEELLDLLLSQPGVDVNIRCRSGWTPLMNACNEENVKMTRRLCEVPQLDPNITDKSGTKSALFYALYRNNIECVKILRTVSKTNWNMKNSDGEYPIIIALKKQVIKETNT